MAGIYIHIPFCRKQCSYCDFHFSTTFDAYRGRLLSAINTEIQQRSKEVGEAVQTIYFGGGTPSLLVGAEIMDLLTTIRDNFELDSPEITLETNPDDFSEKALSDWLSAGINRLSIGVQSLKNSDLEWMNRAHTSEEAQSAIAMAKTAGFTNITIDLIYGLPGLSEDDWRQNIEWAIKTGVPHVSAYCLTVENRTLLSKKVRSGELVIPDEQIQSEQYDLLVDLLQSAGILQYEVSNFAKPGFESKHNRSYWRGSPYLGVGPSAHSFDGGRVRRWNISNNQLYMKGVENGQTFFEEEELTVENRFNELLLIGLRQITGVELDKLETILPLEKYQLDFIDTLILDHLAILDERKLKLTKEGMLRADYITSELFH